ncbi:MAG TPA: sigma-70 family RNA polymerase sigma factor [Urbifossiella sp.]|nr:sigma-70 family RNA polymerase sigma factor [Urbifossiella sp.]
MADRPAGFLGRLRRFPPADLAGVIDAALLDQFAAARDEAPFAELVRRHGPMVLGVCRRVLGHTDADDAFQAAFLVLARKAGAVRGRPVGGWLCRVAGNVARRQRDQARRRLGHETRAGSARPVAVTFPAPAGDLAAVIDAELGRLPDGERAAVVACLLEGRTQEDAARELGWSFSTLRRRLDRGKELLRRRLTGRGVTAPAGFVGVTLAESVPPALADLTRVGAVGFARGVKTAAPAVSLAEGVLTMMARTKLAAVAGVVVAAAGLTVGTGWALQPAPGGPGGGPASQPGYGGGVGLPGGQPPADKAPRPGGPGGFGGGAAKAEAPPADGRIRPGDRLQITARNVLPNDPISGVFLVEPNGKVLLGPAYGGRVALAGKTFEEAEALILFTLKQVVRDPLVSVTAAFTDDPSTAARLAGLEARVRLLEQEVARLKGGAGAAPAVGAGLRP